MMSTIQRSWATGFYWAGVALAVAFLALVWAGNTELLWRFEHSGFPVSWVLAGGAVIAFLAFELCDTRVSLPCEAVERSTEFSADWEAV
jgi:hypothetical protein